MKKRFTEEQIVKILLEQQNEKSVSEIARDNNISEQIYYNWKKKSVQSATTHLTFRSGTAVLAHGTYEASF